MTWELEGSVVSYGTSSPTVPDRTHTVPWVPYHLPDRSRDRMAATCVVYCPAANPNYFKSKCQEKKKKQITNRSSEKMLCLRVLDGLHSKEGRKKKSVQNQIPSNTETEKSETKRYFPSSRWCTLK